VIGVFVTRPPFVLRLCIARLRETTVIRYTVNVNLVIVSYKQKHKSGIGMGTIHREVYTCVQKIQDVCEAQ